MRVSRILQSSKSSLDNKIVVELPKSFNNMYRYCSKSRDFYMSKLDMFIKAPFDSFSSKMIIGMSVTGCVIGGVIGGNSVSGKYRYYSRSYENRHKDEIVMGMIGGGAAGLISGFFWPVLPLVVPVYLTYKTIEITTKDCSQIN